VLQQILEAHLYRSAAAQVAEEADDIGPRSPGQSGGAILGAVVNHQEVSTKQLLLPYLFESAAEALCLIVGRYDDRCSRLVHDNHPVG
jgi:hypothetical protein